SQERAQYAVTKYFHSCCELGGVILCTLVRATVSTASRSTRTHLSRTLPVTPASSKSRRSAHCQSAPADLRRPFSVRKKCALPRPSSHIMDLPAGVGTHRSRRMLEHYSQIPSEH